LLTLDRKTFPLTANRPAARLHDPDYETSAQSILSNSRASPHAGQVTGEPRAGGSPAPVLFIPAVFHP